MASNPKNFATPALNSYGVGPFYDLDVTLVGGGSGKNLTVPLPLDPTFPATSIEITPTYTSTGTYLLTFQDSYWAVASWYVVQDDINGTTPTLSYLGQWANLQTQTPLTCVLTTYTGSAVAADVALNTPVRIRIRFKKDATGASA